MTALIFLLAEPLGLPAFTRRPPLGISDSSDSFLISLWPLNSTPITPARQSRVAAQSPHAVSSLPRRLLGISPQSDDFLNRLAGNRVLRNARRVYWHRNVCTVYGNVPGGGVGEESLRACGEVFFMSKKKREGIPLYHHRLWSLNEKTPPHPNEGWTGSEPTASAAHRFQSSPNYTPGERSSQGGYRSRGEVRQRSAPLPAKTISITGRAEGEGVEPSRACGLSGVQDRCRRQSACPSESRRQHSPEPATAKVLTIRSNPTQAPSSRQPQAGTPPPPRP